MGMEPRLETALAASSPHDFNKATPPPVDRRRYHWGGGLFETAYRPFTPLVEGRLEPEEAVVMVTLRGGAEYHDIVTDDGFRFRGPDRAGTVSFLPAGCGRRLTLRGVAWQWASITLRSDLLAALGNEIAVRPFSARSDDVVLGLLSEMERIHAADDRLDATYCDAMSFAIVQYLARRFWEAPRKDASSIDRLPPWRLRRIVDYIHAHLGDEIRIAELARLIEISEGHLHRAFRSTTGQTPLAFITSWRVEAAKQLLSTKDIAIATVAHRVGFGSQSHFARTFRAATGTSPRCYRDRYNPS